MYNYINSTGLTANTQYFYRVRAYNFTINYSAYSNEADATTWPLPPAAPTLVSPASGATGQNVNPTLDWSEPVGAVSYRVQVSTNSTFTGTGIVVVDEPITGATNSNYTVATALNHGVLYYWRAKALDTYGRTSAWSAMRTFKTGQ